MKLLLFKVDLAKNHDSEPSKQFHYSESMLLMEYHVEDCDGVHDVILCLVKG